VENIFIYFSRSPGRSIWKVLSLEFFFFQLTPLYAFNPFFPLNEEWSLLGLVYPQIPRYDVMRRNNDGRW
jgi:hypothetical protein